MSGFGSLLVFVWDESCFGWPGFAIDDSRDEHLASRLERRNMLVGNNKRQPSVVDGYLLLKSCDGFINSSAVLI